MEERIVTDLRCCVVALLRSELADKKVKGKARTKGRTAGVLIAIVVIVAQATTREGQSRDTGWAFCLCETRL